jgi:hypothetical protein
MTAKTLTMLPLAAVLLAAAFTTPPLGLVGIAEAAKKQKVDPEEDAVPHEHITSVADLDIKDYGFKGKNAYIQVYGTAGGTIAEHDEEEEGFGHAVAYVLNIVTARGEAQTWAIDSHEAQHGSTTDPSTMWHAHRVHLTNDPVTGEPGKCVNEVDEVTHAMMDGNRVIFEGLKVRTERGVQAVVAKEITSAATVLLEVQVADPDNPGDAPCVALVAHVFDIADLGVVRDSRPR